MEYRLGTCASCEAQYRVPATFKANQAKCKKCSGVVEIGPVQGGAGLVPPPPPATKPPAAKKPAAKPRPAAARPAAKPAAKAAPKAGTPRGGSGDSVRSAAEAAAERVRSAGTKGSSRKSSAGAKSDDGPSKSSSRSSPRRKRSKPEPKKKNWGVVIGALVLLAGGVAAATFFMNKGDSEAQAAETEVVAEAPVTPEIEAPLEAEVPEEAPIEEPEEIPDEPEPERAPAAEKDPDSVDLSLLADQVKLDETPDEEWANLRDLVATFVDPDAGAAGNRARKQLLEQGRVAFPAILNAFKRIDVTSQDGYRTGDLIQKLLMDICRGNNFDWHYTTEPNDAYFNKRVIEMWFKSWAQVVENPKAWIQLGKLTEEEAVEYMAQFESVEDIGVSDDLDDF